MPQDSVCNPLVLIFLVTKVSVIMPTCIVLRKIAVSVLYIHLIKPFFVMSFYLVALVLFVMSVLWGTACRFVVFAIRSGQTAVNVNSL